MLPLSHKCATIILFWVRVPVLSEQMTLVEAKVSTPLRFFTRQFFLAILRAVRVIVRRPCRNCQSVIADKYIEFEKSCPHLGHICHK